MKLPPPILSNEPGSFPGRVLAQRHPALLAQVRAAHPYGAGQQSRLDELLASITTGTISAVPSDLVAGDRWAPWNREWAGQSWFDVPFLVAENFFYRHLLDAAGYFAPGPWQGVDPFAHLKSAELASVDVAEPGDGQRALLASVWGNQADLGFRVTAQLDAAAARADAPAALSAGPSAGPSAGLSAGPSAALSSGPSAGLTAGLVCDDSQRLWDRLRSASSRSVVIVADNAGRELIADLMLIDQLLTAGLADQVAVHVKPSPYFVSDAMTADVVSGLEALATASDAGAGVATRLKAAAAQDRLTIQTHWFSCSPLTYHDLPGELADEFAAASVVLLKGDLNYRRLVGDCHWDPETEFASVVRYFPGWVAALRTLKSDVIVGLDRATLERLEATGEPWRTSGSRALIQVAGA